MTTSILNQRDAISEAADARTEYDFDVFVSYHDSDKDWVYDHLIKRLNQADIRCADKEEYRLGAPKVSEMEWFIAESRWTLLVITNDYLESHWDDFFTDMSVSQGLDQKKWRTIPLKLEHGLKLPANLEMLNGIGLDRELKDETAWARLIRDVKGEVRQPKRVAQVPFEQRGAFALRKGLDALVDLLASAEVRETVALFQNDFEACCEQIDILGDYKALHDQLHLLQFQCFNNVAFAATGFPDGPGSYEMLSDARLTLEQIVSQSEAIASRSNVAPQSWIPKLAKVQALLGKALDELDPSSLDPIIRQLVKILATDPSTINDRLNQTASILRLPRLEQDMKAIRGVMNGPELDPKKVEYFDNGLKDLAHLGEGLAAAIEDHNRWQEFDTELRLLETALKDPEYEPSWDWTTLSETMAPLYAGPEPWAEKIRADAVALTQAVEAKNGKRIQQKFRDLRAKAGIRFYEIDRELLRHCEVLRSIGQPLCMLMEFVR